MNKEFFISYCKTVGIPFKDANKIIDGRYKPYLSALDDRYYPGNDVWDAKYNALNHAIKVIGKDLTKQKPSSLTR